MFSSHLSIKFLYPYGFGKKRDQNHLIEVRCRGTVIRSNGWVSNMEDLFIA